MHDQRNRYSADVRRMGLRNLYLLCMLLCNGCHMGVLVCARSESTPFPLTAQTWEILTCLTSQTMNKTLEQIDDAFGDDSGLEEQELMHEVLGQIFVHP